MPGDYAYGQRGWGTGSGGGPNIQYPIGGATWPGGSYFSGGAGGAGFGSGIAALMRRRMLGAGGIPERPGAMQPGTGTGGRGEPMIPGTFGRPRPDTGVLGELGLTPEGWARNRENKFTPFSELQNLVNTRNTVNAGLGRQRGFGTMGQGAPFGGQDDMLRRLLQARMQGGGL